MAALEWTCAERAPNRVEQETRQGVRLEIMFMFTRTELRFLIRRSLSFNSGFEWDWDNSPAEDAGESDYRCILSVGYGY